jgi:hypothetical protein
VPPIRRVGSRRSGVGEQLLDVDRIESICPIAEIAANFYMPLLCEHGANLLRPQGSQHADDALAGAAALEEDRRRLEHPHIVFREQPTQDVSIAQRLQLFGL